MPRRGNLLIPFTDLHSKNKHCAGRLPRRFAPRNDIVDRLSCFCTAYKILYVFFRARAFPVIPGRPLLCVLHKREGRKIAESDSWFRFFEKT